DLFKDRHAIYDCLIGHARGLDRRDPALIMSAYHPDATEDHGAFSGSASGFVAFIFEFYDSIGVWQTTHRVNQSLIEFDGPDTASVETYTLDFLDTDTESGKVARTIGGRYLDRFERRAGEWKIAHRSYVMDWNRNESSAVDMDGMYFGDLARGRRDTEDKSYSFLSSQL
ncbi:MAG: nuclear transport factor 2 family protein, partial [Acidimicrobiales bacterium]